MQAAATLTRAFQRSEQFLPRAVKHARNLVAMMVPGIGARMARIILVIGARLAARIGGVARVAPRIGARVAPRIGGARVAPRIGGARVAPRIGGARVGITQAVGARVAAKIGVRARRNASPRSVPQSQARRMPRPAKQQLASGIQIPLPADPALPTRTLPFCGRPLSGHSARRSCPLWKSKLVLSKRRENYGLQNYIIGLSCIVHARQHTGFGFWQVLFWTYARARWTECDMDISDEGFGQMMQMIGQEFAILKPSEVEAS